MNTPSERGDNGYKEKVDRLRIDLDNLGSKLSELDHFGTTVCKVTDAKMNDLKEDVQKAKMDIEAIMTRQNLWNGGLAVLVVVVGWLFR